MKFAMCNEFCEGWPIEDVLRLAAEAGYRGVEIAPFTLAPSVRDVSARRRRRIRRSAEEAGVEIAGIHWLLVSPEGLHINHPDDELRRKTQDYFVDLIHFCADIGGKVMTVGSPKQRDVIEGETYEATWRRTVEFFRVVTEAAACDELSRGAERDVLLGMEPLARVETNFLNTKDDVVRLIEEVNHPNFRMTLDCKAMNDEEKPIPQIIREGRRFMAHCHVNDDNRSYPGTGGLDFVAIMKALVETAFDGWVSLEVFDFSPGPEKIAREGIAHLKECLEAACDELSRGARSNLKR